jgi:hypothetical protein
MKVNLKAVFGQAWFGEAWIDALPAVVILAQALAFLVVGYRYPPLARQFPVTVALVVLVLAGLDIASRINAPVARLLKNPRDSRGGSTGEFASRRVQIAAVLWLAGFAVLLLLVGVLSAVPLYVLASLRLRGHRPWLRCVLAAAASTAIVWLLFSAALRIELYRGIIFGGS